MPKQMLILKASEDIDNAELQSIVHQSSLYNIESEIVEIKDENDLQNCIYNGNKYDYIYLATHGCKDSFGNISDTLNVSWIKFAAYVCSGEIANPEAIFFHSCCRGGLNKVAWEMFACCQQIEYVCGPRHDVYNLDLLISFNLFIYFIENRKIDPVRASEKVMEATDVRLVCLDRIETELEGGYINHCGLIQDNIDSVFEEIMKQHAANRTDETKHEVQIGN